MSSERRPGGRDLLGMVDFSNPGVLPMVQVLARTQRSAARAFRPPEGVSLRWASCDSGDGTAVDCAVLEPEGAAGSLPVLLYCHGGAFFFPLQVSTLALAARYCGALSLRVVLPDYRLLPAHPAPAALWDCWGLWRSLGAEAERWGADPNRLLLYGESAGGCLAAGVALLARDRGGPAALGQLLIYPVLDTCRRPRRSMTEFTDGAWPLRSIRFMWDRYLEGADAAARQYLVPMEAADLSGLPPAYIEPQYCDALRDEGVAYAGRLRAAGVSAACEVLHGAGHGFDADLTDPLTQRAIRRRVQIMGRLLEGGADEIHLKKENVPWSI